MILINNHRDWQDYGWKINNNNWWMSISMISNLHKKIFWTFIHFVKTAKVKYLIIISYKKIKYTASNVCDNKKKEIN
jgi:hypothetical protein